MHPVHSHQVVEELSHGVGDAAGRIVEMTNEIPQTGYPRDALVERLRDHLLEGGCLQISFKMLLRRMRRGKLNFK